MPTFVTTIHFHDVEKDAVTVVVEATDKTDATNQVYDVLDPVEPVQEVDALNLKEFVDSYGDYFTGQFPSLRSLL